MKDGDLRYLAGLFDGVGRVMVNISPSETTSTGFQVQPEVRIGLRKSDEIILGMLDEYCEVQGVRYSLYERSDQDTVRFVVQSIESARRFLGGFADHLVRQYESVHILLEEILPAMDEGQHNSKQGLYELMEIVGEMRAADVSGRSSKYTQEWFEEEWESELVK